MATPSTANGRIASGVRHIARCGLIALAAFASTAAEAAPPKIRTDAANVVPRCVTPKRLMAFIKTRNPNLDPRFADIASLYRKHGETWRVRWDYAFFQMVVETNFLTYRRGDGRWGDVDPRQNNFAGLGTTGGGVPGDSYPNVSTGVLAQIQHLVVYSGQRIENPVGERTRLKQDHILANMASKNGQTTFSDLARRWAADKHYGASIEWVASNFRQNFCTGPDPVEEAVVKPQPKPQKRTASVKPALAPAANLGGPQPAEPSTEMAPGPLVRTIWSAADAPAGAATENTATATPPVRTPAATTAESSARKSVKVASLGEGSSAVVSEQMLQTGQRQDAEPAASDTAAEAPAVTFELEAPTSTSTTATAASSATPSQRPVAFGYAGALGAALTKAKPAASTCNVASASYGGKKVLLVRSGSAEPLRFTVLTVLEGFEKSMLDSYLKAHLPNGSSIGEFATRDAAFAKAKELCASAAAAPKAEGASAG